MAARKTKFGPWKHRTNGDVEFLDLKGAGVCEDRKFACVIQNVFTPDECDRLIARSEEQGYENAFVNSRGKAQILLSQVRNNDRSIIDDPVTAEEIWTRIRTKVNDNNDLMTASWANSVKPRMGFKKNNSRERRAVGLNERLRFLRYDQGTFFASHYDGNYTRRNEAGAERNGETSFVTMMLYLNEDFRGGSTRFVRNDCDKVGVAVTPRTGMVLLFQHDIYHEGAPLISGRKYAIRSDVMYSTHGAAFDYSVRPFWNPNPTPQSSQQPQMFALQSRKQQTREQLEDV